ncbi:NUDIX domain-containing protein [Nocardiopsis nanhaiensis]
MQINWKRLESAEEYTHPRLRVYRDRVLSPAGTPMEYLHMRSYDLVRIVACNEFGQIALVCQEHYVTGTALQLPGGAVGEDETPQAAAARELVEEVGLRGGQWHALESVIMRPDLDAACTSLWCVTGAQQGISAPEGSEADLEIAWLHPEHALGLVECAASMAGIGQYLASSSLRRRPSAVHERT